MTALSISPKTAPYAILSRVSGVNSLGFAVSGVIREVKQTTYGVLYVLNDGVDAIHHDDCKPIAVGELAA